VRKGGNALAAIQLILLLYSMKRFPAIHLVIFLFVGLLFSACEKDGDEQAEPASIEYTLSADEAGVLADIEYTSGFGLIRLVDEPLPWSIDFKAIFELGDELILEAESGAQSEMSAQITVDDQVVASGSGTHRVQISYIKGLK
jgi:hypothetical protein